MDYGQIIILIGYVIGFLILFFHQKKVIEPLRQQLKSQSEILSSAEKYMNIFDIARLESYVKISEKTFRQEKEEAIKKIEKQRNEKVKNVDMLLSENLELFFTISRLSYVFARHSFFLKTIKEMENVISKPLLLKKINKRKEELEAQGIGEVGWITKMQAIGIRLQETFGQKEKPSSSQK